jgi:hypothetical protein
LNPHLFHSIWFRGFDEDLETGGGFVTFVRREENR